MSLINILSKKEEKEFYLIKKLSIDLMKNMGV